MERSQQGRSFPEPAKALGALLLALLQRETVATLTMTEPWGTLVASGAKRIETRSWLTTHRGPLAIHLARTLPAAASALCDQQPFQTALAAAGYRRSTEHHDQSNPWQLPLGRVVAITWLETVERLAPNATVEELERSFGNFAPGRYAWHFSTIYRLTRPIAARGSLGVWDWMPPPAFWDEVQQQWDALHARSTTGREDMLHEP